MTTAAALEAITDRSLFERLATAVLRAAEPRYAPLIHTGMNADGETIVSPVDGLHLVPQSRPPHYVFVQHTTTDRGRLRGKWLTADDADLPKAVEQARRVRGQLADAEFTVVLTTNQRVDPELVIDVTARGRADGVEVDIWEQSRLAGFLDASPDGQWLRWKHLGVVADRLSADLLHALGRRSLELYRHEEIPPHHPPMAERGTAGAVLAAASGGLCLVLGRSGFGKSVAAAEALARLLSTGGLGLWLPARALEGAASLEIALGGWLSTLHPTLQTGAGGVAVEVAAARGGLAVFLDDVNRSPDPARLLRLASGAAGPTGNGGGGPDVPRPAVVVPIWPEQLPKLPPGLTKQAWVRMTHVGEFLPAEAEEALRRAVPDLSAAASGEYATRLGHDPLLVGLFATLARDGAGGGLRAVADDAIGEFVRRCTREAAETPGTDLLAVEARAALDRVGWEMLTRRSGRPAWDELAGWLGQGLARAARALVRHGGLCRVDGGRLAFRHDRVRDWVLSGAAAELLSAADFEEGVVADPHYARVVGEALAETPLPDGRLARIRAAAPWALFEAVRRIGEPSKSHHERVFAEAHSWAATDSRSAPESVRAVISWTLLETDSSRALSLIDAFEPDWVLMAAGLRNGSAAHGMRFLRDTVRHDFEPGGDDALRDRFVDHAVRGHGPELIRGLRTGLSDASLPPDDVSAYLALLGHCRFPEFDGLIHQVWRRHGDDVLSYALWAAARCPLGDPSGCLGPLIERFAALPASDPDDRVLPARARVAQYLGWSFRRGITPEALALLTAASAQNADLRGSVSALLGGVDDPDAAEFVVRRRAELALRLDDIDPDNRPRSARTADRLRSLWESPAEPDGVRARAFAAWLRGTGGRDREPIRAIGPDSPLYRDALWHRVKSSDTTAVPGLCTLLRNGGAGDGWWPLADRVWCAELRVLAEEALGALASEVPADLSARGPDCLYRWAELLVRLPVGDAVALLTAHWERLKYARPMVHAAYRIGPPDLVALADEIVARCPPEVDIFHLAFSTTWEQYNAANPITLGHLRGLESHVGRMTAQEILFLAWAVERGVGPDEAITDWVRGHLVPRLPPGDQARVRGADQRLLAALDRAFAETQYEPRLGFVFEDRKRRRAVFPGRQLALLGDWLAAHRTVRGLEVAGECLKHIGSRRDLGLLDRCPVAGDPAEVERVKAGVRFSVGQRTLE